MSRLNLRDERGVSAVLVALLIVPLFGFGALAVDAAAIYSERRQLQNGADAAALAIAHDCASGLPACGTHQATADELTAANYDEAGSTHGVPVVTLGSNQVTVLNPGTQDHWLAPVIGIDSTDVTASATARWGAPGAGTAVLPLAFSTCAIDKFMVDGQPTDDLVLLILPKQADDGCTGTSGLPMPGSFAWLEPDPGVCGATSEIDGTTDASTGNSVPSECSPEYFQELIGQIVLLPIYDDAGDTGANGWYRIYGYAAFEITGFNFGGQYYSSPKPCTGEERCLEGYFREFVDPSDAFSYDPAAPDHGARVVSLIA